MPASRWAHVLSFDLGWMPPAAARAFVSQGVATALLRAEGEELRLTVDPAQVEVPRGFRPGPQSTAAAAMEAVRQEPPAPSEAATPAPEVPIDPFLDWLERYSSRKGIPRAKALEEVSAVQERMGGRLTAIAALLWLAARSGLDVREAAAAAATT